MVCSAGITSPNLPVMKTRLDEKKKKKIEILIMEYQMADAGNKMKKRHKAALL